MRTEELLNYADKCFKKGVIPKPLTSLSDTEVFKLCFNSLVTTGKAKTFVSNVAKLFLIYGCTVKQDANKVNFIITR